MSSLERSRSYVVIVAAGALLAVSPFMPWTKAYGETDASLVKVAGDSTDMGFLPWLIVIFGILVALGATRRTVTAYVIILVTSVVMLAAAFLWTSTAITEAYVVGGAIQFGMWAGFGSIGVMIVTTAAELLRI